MGMMVELCVVEKVVFLGLGQETWVGILHCLIDLPQFGNMGGQSQGVLQLDKQHCGCAYVSIQNTSNFYLPSSIEIF